MPPTLPKSCEVADLATWVHKMWAFDDRIMPEDTEMARAVRALLEITVRRALVASQSDPGHVESVREVNDILARVLGAP